MKFDRNELVDAMETVADELENAMKELHMWREFYCKNLLCNSLEKQDFNLRILEAPIGIENIEEFIEKELKCYRETQEKIK
jgi:hypothetical protein